MVNSKCQTACRCLNVILCVGESWNREQGTAERVGSGRFAADQWVTASDLDSSSLLQFLGHRTEYSDAGAAQEMHAFIRSVFAEGLSAGVQQGGSLRRLGQPISRWFDVQAI